MLGRVAGSFYARFLFLQMRSYSRDSVLFDDLDDRESMMNLKRERSC